MNESPVISHPRNETVVPDPTAFLLDDRNKAFIQGKRPLPNVSFKTNTFAIIFVCVWVMGILTGLAFVNRAFTINSNPSVPIFVMSLLGLFLALLLPFLYMQFHFARRSKGRIIEGSILATESIEIQRGGKVTESIGIRYQFTTPTGTSITSRAERPIKNPTYTDFPNPDTRVYIWYISDTTYGLL